MTDFARSFAPIVTSRSKLLILGTMPGRKALQQQQYYGNPHNAFWKIMFTLFDKELSPVYKERLQLLKSNRVAVWDMLHTCIRPGSLDSSIENEEPNDIAGLLERYRGIKAIVFNGNNPYKYFKKYVGLNTGHDYFIMPSTSPANRTRRFEQKLESWYRIIELLGSSTPEQKKK